MKPKSKQRTERFPSARVTKTTIRTVKRMAKETGQSVADILEKLFADADTSKKANNP